jgi:hypothetical protein
VRQPTNQALGPPALGGAHDFAPAGAPPAASATGGDLRSQVVALANQVGRPDIAANPDYWVGIVQSKGQGPGGANGALDTGYFGDLMRNANGGAGGASATTSGGSVGQFLQPFTGTFAAPRGTDDPGFQFALQQGTDAIQRSAAAKGNLLTGGTLKDLASYTTGAALQDYSGAYNRALQTFGTNYDIFRNNQTDPYNKLVGVTGLGLNATNNLNNTGSSYAQNNTNLITNQGNANAGATIAGQNNLNSNLSSLNNWFQNYPYTRNLSV